MHDFSCTNANDIHYTEIAERIRFLKEDDEGVRTMCRSIEEMLKEEKERNTLEFARRMIALTKNPLEEIAECTGLTVEEVRKLESEVRGKQ